jgi:hypothetical protein
VAITLPRSYPPSDLPRDAVIRVCVTAEEKARLQRLAHERGRSLSELLRVAAAPLLEAHDGGDNGRLRLSDAARFFGGDDLT